MSKIESGENRMNIETFDLTEQIREIDMLIYAKYRFVITDNGIGMNPDHIGHIYDKFYTTSKEIGQNGNGLGLTLTKKIIELHNFSIHVDSKEHKGTKFEILLDSV